MESLNPDPAKLHYALNTRIPFGKYQGRHLIDLPEAYLVWFQRKGWPAGPLGEAMETILTIKTNGLSDMMRKLIDHDD